MLKILPQLFFTMPQARKIMADGLSCIFYKKYDEPVLQKEGYVSAHVIIQVRKGLLRIENDEGLLAEASENQMIFLPKGIYSASDILPEKGSFEAIMFFFDDEVITSFLSSLNLKITREKCVSHMVIDVDENIRVFTSSLLQLYDKNPNVHSKLTAAKLFEFLHLITASEQTKCFVAPLRTLNNKERKGLKAFMGTNFHKPLSIEDYAYLTGRSLSTFRRDFKTLFGISPKQWLIGKRMEKAHELLSKNNTTITRVVEETGYENISHFIKAFHKKYGISPKQFLIQKRKEVLV
jgi:AraC family transcriptional regulator, exoenzyme S synthesis regulatory protein ExsA